MQKNFKSYCDQESYDVEPGEESVEPKVHQGRSIRTTRPVRVMRSTRIRRY